MGREAGGGSLAGGRAAPAIPGLESRATGRGDSLEGRLDGQRANLSFGRGARLQAASLAEPSTLHLGQPRLNLAGTALELAYQPLALHFAGPLQAQVGQLRQANLKPLA